jgi:hypothetical protein
VYDGDLLADLEPLGLVERTATVVVSPRRASAVSARLSGSSMGAAADRARRLEPRERRGDRYRPYGLSDTEAALRAGRGSGSIKTIVVPD